MKIREFLTRHNRLFIPLIAILYALLVFSLSLYYVYLPLLMFIILIFTIPIVMFLLMHFLGMYKFKPRLFGGIVILLVVLIIVGGMYSTYFYDLNGKESKDINGTSINVDISPFSGVDKNYNFTIITDYKGSLNNSYLYIYSGGTYSQNISYNRLNHTEKNGIITMYYDTKLPSGLYDTNYTITGNITVTMAGPVNVNRVTFYEFYVFALEDRYIASIGILYVIGLTVAYFLGKKGITRY